MSDAQPVPVDPDAVGQRLRKIAMYTALLGVAHAVLFVIAVLLLAAAPGPGATDQEIVDFYNSEKDRALTLAGLYVMPFAGIAFIWFIVTLRTWLGVDQPARSLLQSNVQLVAGISTPPSSSPPLPLRPRPPHPSSFLTRT